MEGVMFQDGSFRCVQPQCLLLGHRLVLVIMTPVLTSVGPQSRRLSQQQFTPSQCPGEKAHNPAVGGAVLPLKPREDGPSRLSHPPGGPATLGSWPSRSSLCPWRLLASLPLCLCPLVIGTPVTGLWAHPTPAWPRLSSITSAKTLFPDEVPSPGHLASDFNVRFGGTQSKP